VGPGPVTDPWVEGHYAGSDSGPARWSSISACLSLGMSSPSLTCRMYSVFLLVLCACN
jgi:hypothetical protein